MIKGLKELLQSIETWEEISGIIPGRISPSKVSALHLTIQYETSSGIKCLAKGDGVQEVFFVSSDPKSLLFKLQELE